MSAIEQPGSDLPDNLPLLTEEADGDTPNELPTLTEIFTEEQAELAGEFQPGASAETPHHEMAVAASSGLNDKEMLQLLQHLEAHLEIIFTRKLNLHLEQMQRKAIELAVNELKTELPELLRDALNT